MILIVVTDTQVVLGACSPDNTKPMINTVYNLERNQVYELSLFNSSWLKSCIIQCAQTYNLAKAPVALALGSTSLQEFWQQTRPACEPNKEALYYVQEQPVFNKTYYALMRYDQILQYHLACLPAHTLVCLTTLSIAWYYAYRIYYPTETINADTLTALQQALYAPECLQQANTQCPLVYACAGLAYIARCYTQE